MIVYIPDPCEASGKLVTLARPDFASSPTQRYMLVDVGLSAARNGVVINDYLRIVKKAALHAARRRYDEIVVVVPDAFWDYTKTIEYYRRYATLIRRVAAVAKLAFVAQELKAPPPDIDYDVVAIPARRMGHINCSREPRRCAQRIADFATTLRMLGVKRVHLLGPAKAVLKLIPRDLYDSFDTMAYRLAPSKSAKHDRGYMATGEVACKWFETWIAGI